MGFDRFLPVACALVLLAAPGASNAQRLSPSVFANPPADAGVLAMLGAPPAGSPAAAGALAAGPFGPVNAPLAGLPARRALPPISDDEDTGLAMAGTFAGGIGFLFGATIGSAIGASRCTKGDDGCKLRDALAAGGTGAAVLIPLSIHSANKGRGKLLPAFLISLAENAAGLGLTSLIPADAGMALSGLITAPLSIVTSAAIEKATMPPTPPVQPAPSTAP